MNDAREFLKDSLLKISKGRNRSDFVKYIDNTVVEYVSIYSADWKDENTLEVYVNFLPFMSEDLSEKGFEEHCAFIQKYLPELISVDLSDELKVQRLAGKLNIFLYSLLKDKIVELVRKDVNNQKEVFKSNISKNGLEDFNVKVYIKRPEVFTPTVIHSIRVS